MSTLTRDEETVDFLGGGSTLQLLTVQETSLDLLERLSGTDELLGALSVTATVAGGDQVGDTSRFVRETGMISDEISLIQC